ncbi:hypothetical protein MSAN_00924100 [Mycena sanguinolenta]|uniref:Uncharacterized protein n=1 Tax=Mycena sanguinolenta TaxID=230812 RepID=A0A8H6YWT0_9AGAR|nr:hypothetical protein MSAN_00924100 [Mycena sanguinolenta]
MLNLALVLNLLSKTSALYFSAKNTFIQNCLFAFCSRPPVELLLAAPSLRILLIEHWRNHGRMAMVTPRFDTPLVVPLLDDPFPPVVLRSLAEVEVDVARCATFDRDALLAVVKARMVDDPSFDPYGIEWAWLNDPFEEWTGLMDFSGQDELDYLAQ